MVLYWLSSFLIYLPKADIAGFLPARPEAWLHRIVAPTRNLAGKQSRVEHPCVTIQCVLLGR